MTLEAKANLSFLRSVQVTRSDIIFWIMGHGCQADEAHPNIPKKRPIKRIFLEDLRKRPIKMLSADFEGLFIRILVQENEGTKEEYRVGRVIGVKLGDAYHGFSFDDSHHTRIILQVLHDEMPVSENSPRARRSPSVPENYALYQLTTVSNKEFQLDEAKKWKVSPESFPHSVLEQYSVRENASRSKQKVPSAIGQHGLLFGKYSYKEMVDRVKLIKQTQEIQKDIIKTVEPQSASRVSESEVQMSPKAISEAYGEFNPSQLTERDATLDDTSQEVMISQTEKLSVSKCFDSAFLEELERDVEEELKQNKFLVPANLNQVSATQCREIERDIIDYLEKIKQNLSRYNVQCVICMAEDAVVLLLPCKHKVLCRACGTKVHLCPMCRVPIREVFEPLQL